MFQNCKTPLLTMLLLAAFVSDVGAAAPSSSPVSVAPLLTKPLQGIAGKEGMMLIVEFAPGADGTPHRHNANTFVYVLEGSIVMQVQDGALVTLTPGQTFYESPSDVHSVSRNASTTQRAKILVFFVKDAGAPVSVPAG